MIGVKIFFLALISLGILLSTILINSSIATNGDGELCLVTVSPDPIIFDSLLPEDFDEKSATVSNTGDFTATVEIKGTPWTSAGPSFDVNYTDYKCSSPGAGSSCMVSTYQDLTESDQALGTVASGESFQTDFKLIIPNNQPPDDYTQTITFSFECEVVE